MIFLNSCNTFGFNLNQNYKKKIALNIQQIKETDKPIQIKISVPLFLNNDLF